MGSTVSSSASAAVSTTTPTTLQTNNNNPNNKGPNTKPLKKSSVSLLSFDVESLENSRWWRAGFAGSIAGLCEHTLLYPIDTVKTRMQAAVKSGAPKKSFINIFTQIIKQERPITLFRGWPAVVVAAVPSHGVYFGAYEFSKYKLGALHAGLHPFKIALSGAFAAMAHDLIVTPCDVVKQRMQLQNCPYNNICSCAFKTLNDEGYFAFFRSYPTTVLLNIPTFSTNFVVYESSKILLRDTILESEENWFHHLIAGGIAGGIAGFISNPLDVIKTYIQIDDSHLKNCETKDMKQKKKSYQPIRKIVKQIMFENKNKPYRIFFSGATARVTYMIPSAAITWTVYEAMKEYLGFPIHDVEII